MQTFDSAHEKIRFKRLTSRQAHDIALSMGFCFDAFSDLFDNLFGQVLFYASFKGHLNSRIFIGE